MVPAPVEALTGQKGTGLWLFTGQKVPRPWAASWNIPYAPNRTQAWVVDPYPGTALSASSHCRAWIELRM